MHPKPEITVETVIPPPPPVDPGPSYSTSSEGYFRPRDTLNKDVIRSAGPVSRASSMQMTPQTPRQLLLNPQEHNSWTLMDKSPRSPTIVISPPSEEHLATIDYSNSSQQLPSKHRQSMLKAACLAFFVLCTVVFLIILLFLFS